MLPWNWATLRGNFCPGLVRGRADRGLEDDINILADDEAVGAFDGLCLQLGLLIEVVE